MLSLSKNCSSLAEAGSLAETNIKLPDFKTIKLIFVIHLYLLWPRYVIMPGLFMLLSNAQNNYLWTLTRLVISIRPYLGTLLISSKIFWLSACCCLCRCWERAFFSRSTKVISGDGCGGDTVVVVSSSSFCPKPL